MENKTNNRDLSELLKAIRTGKTQLPEFQRSWVWNDTQIRKLIESITFGFPMGAAMFLENGGEAKFKSRPFTGVELDTIVEPENLVLDGQQRLTTLYQALMSKKPVETKTDKKKIERFYYLDIKKCLDNSVDRLDAIISVGPDKKVKEDIGRTVTLDLSTQEKEIENLMFPLNIIFNGNEFLDWGRKLIFLNDQEKYDIYKQFDNTIIETIRKYELPVIQLSKSTSKEAICQIFENVNTGGVPLTVFELVTASFAADGYNLREDWDNIKKQFKSKPNGELLNEIDGAFFLQAITLLVTYKKNQEGKGAISCKKKDILNLSLSNYKEERENLIEGFGRAINFLIHQGVYRSKDLPYSSQLIPLAVIYAYDKQHNNYLSLNPNLEKLRKWYWCGVFGEMYGGANETRYSLDVADLFEWFNNNKTPDTVQKSNFQPTRLLSLQTRNSAAYKGVMALIQQDSPLDFMTGNKMDIASFLNEETDIHHIFPQSYCISQKYPENKWNSVVNKTPIYASTNRSIGGRAPSEYIQTMRNKGLEESMIRSTIESHKVNYEMLAKNNFNDYVVDRATQILDGIEQATGKTISGRDSEETIEAFGNKLINQP